MDITRFYRLFERICHLLVIVTLAYSGIKEASANIHVAFDTLLLNQLDLPLVFLSLSMLFHDFALRHLKPSLTQ